MNKVRINDLARELEVKSRPILDALEAIGVSGKTHSSSIDEDQADRVRAYFRGDRSGTTPKPAPEAKPRFDLSNVSKPGDAMRAILERKNAQANAQPNASAQRSCCSQGSGHRRSRSHRPDPARGRDASRRRCSA